jgi:hypothetical protein
MELRSTFQIVLFSDEPFVYGEKGLPRRKEVISAYTAKIRSVGPWMVNVD